MQDELFPDTSATDTPDAQVEHTPASEAEVTESVTDGASAVVAQMGITRMSLMELKLKSPSDLLALAEALEIENANSMRKQDMMFGILKTVAEEGVEISGGGVMEVVQDGFGFLRSPEANYLPGPDDIYVSPSQIRKFGLRTGDSVEGPIRAPREGER